MHARLILVALMLTAASMKNTNVVKYAVRGIDNVARCAHTGYMTAKQYEVTNARGDSIVITAFTEDQARNVAREHGLKGKRLTVKIVEIRVIGGKNNY